MHDTMPKPIRTFESHARRDPQLVCDGPTALVRLLDAIIDRLADEIEKVTDTMEALSQEIFQSNQQQERRIPVEKLTGLLTRIGRVQTLLTKIRYSSVTTLRMLSFLGGSNRIHAKDQQEVRHHVASLTTDVTSLSEHASYLIDSLTFLLDASLGLISIEQNAAMKLFSWAAIIFLPPTLVSSLYGMNFKIMPELEWEFGYLWAIALMVLAAVLPYLFFRWKRWL